MKMFLQSHIPWIHSIIYMNCQMFSFVFWTLCCTVNAVIQLLFILNAMLVTGRKKCSNIFFIYDMYISVNSNQHHCQMYKILHPLFFNI